MSADNIDIDQTKRELEAKLKQFTKETNALTAKYTAALLELEQKGYKIDKEQIPVFMEEFWHTTPTKNPNEWEVAVPIFIPFNIGWPDRIDGGYKVFIINRYTQWFGDKLPSFIRREVTLPPSLEVTLDGVNLKFPEANHDKVAELFGDHLSLLEKAKATVKQGHEFDLIAEIIDSGCLPFIPKPVDSADLRESDFVQIFDELKKKYIPLEIFHGKRSYQGAAWEIFLKYGAIGIFWLMSLGKTVIGTYIFSRIVGPKVLVVPSVTLKEQWTEFFHLNCPRLQNETEIFTYQGMSRKDWVELSKKEFKVAGFDECHVLPAKSFSKLATLKTKYRFGLSATPYREDGRTNYVMALTGFPVGLDARTLMKQLGKEYHTINVHVVKNLASKFVLAQQLYNPERRTLFFTYRLDIGEKLAAMFNLDFISGKTKKDRLTIVRKSHSFVASQTLEQGLSVKDLEHIIEVDFQFGGRREQVQRTGRLLHSSAKGKIHDIIMTSDELERYGKRLLGLYEKGFMPRLVPHLAGVSLPKAKRKKKTIPPTAKNYLAVVEELYNEGFFQAERYLKDVASECARRGVPITSTVRTAIFGKLDRMVRAKLLFKIKREEGYVFKARK